MDFTIRPLDPASERELDVVVVFSIMTLWESRPELRVDPNTLPEFGFDVTKKRYKAGLGSPTQRYLVALDDDAHLVGHSIAVLRHDDAGKRFGYFWSRYVLPRARRQGLASRFLEDSLAWFAEQDCAYAEIHVHSENTALRAMFEKQGFEVIDKRFDRWRYLVLRKSL